MHRRGIFVMLGVPSDRPRARSSAGDFHTLNLTILMKSCQLKNATKNLHLKATFLSSN